MIDAGTRAPRPRRQFRRRRPAVASRWHRPPRAYFDDGQTPSHSLCDCWQGRPQKFAALEIAIEAAADLLGW